VAYKWSGHDKKAKEILASEDWQAANEKFQLGAAVLNDDFESAADIMRHIGAESSPTKGDYKEWPMFKVFRASPQFAAAYEDVFGEPFGSVTASEISEKKDIGSETVQCEQMAPAGSRTLRARRVAHVQGNKRNGVPHSLP